MNTDYNFRLSVQLPNGKQFSASFRMPAYSGGICRSFEPMDVCTDPMTAMAVGGKNWGMAEAIRRDRKRLAETISKKMTAHILSALDGQDTENGYPAHPTA